MCCIPIMFQTCLQLFHMSTKVIAPVPKTSLIKSLFALMPMSQGSYHITTSSPHLQGWSMLHSTLVSDCNAQNPVEWENPGLNHEHCGH